MPSVSPGESLPNGSMVCGVFQLPVEVSVVADIAGCGATTTVIVDEVLMPRESATT